MFDKQEKLAQYLENHGIPGAWVNPDEYGFSRTFRFNVLGQICEIIWYCNYSTLIIGNAEFWFDRIDDSNAYPRAGVWLEFKFGNGDRNNGVHLKIKED